MAQTLGLASIFIRWIMNPRNFPELTPKAYLVGLRSMLNFFRTQNVSAKSVKCDSIVPPNLLLEHLVHYPLLCCLYIFQPEWHDLVTICALIGNKGSMFPIPWWYPYLVISWECIHKGDELMTWDSINQLINMRKRITILQTCLVQISIINIYRPIPTRLFNEYDIGEPLRVLHLGNKFYY